MWWLLLSGLLLSGCTPTGAGAPAPSSATPSATAPSTTVPSTTAPAAPPPAGPTVAACDLLTPEQVRQSGLDPDTATPVDAGGQRQCSWTGRPGATPTPPLIVAVGPATAGSPAVPTPPGAAVEETEIGGFPASVVTISGFCAVAVRADTATLVVSGGSTECDGTRTIAAAAVGNLT